MYKNVTAQRFSVLGIAKRQQIRAITDLLMYPIFPMLLVVAGGKLCAYRKYNLVDGILQSDYLRRLPLQGIAEGVDACEHHGLN